MSIILAEAFLCQAIFAADFAQTLSHLRPRPSASDGAAKKIARDLGTARDGGKRVLFVEDEELIQESTARLLEQRGYEVVIVDNLADAERRLQTESFDVLLTDNGFPKVSGESVAEEDKRNGEKLVRAYPDIPAVLYTGGSTKDVGQRVGERKSFQVLEKPAGIEKLDAVLKEVSAKDGGIRHAAPVSYPRPSPALFAP